MALSTPQQQAGILSFYDAPEMGPRIDMKIVLIAIALLTLFIVILDHYAAV